MQLIPGPILILGGTGMLGHKLWQVLSTCADVHVAARRAPCPHEWWGMFDPCRWHGGVDACRIDTVRRVIEHTRPAIIINCVGVIKQIPAAKDPIYSIHINSLFPHILYGLARAANAHLVHFSTDCVFSGRRGQYTEADIPDPPDLYGRSKLLGEIDAPGCLTLRTSIIGRELGTAHGLTEWFLAQNGGTVQGFAQAIFTGLPTIVVASMLAELLSRVPPVSGLYHLASSPISKYDLLLLLRDAYGVSVRIERDESFHCDRSLIGERLRVATGLVVPPWPSMIKALAADPTPYSSGSTT